MNALKRLFIVLGIVIGIALLPLEYPIYGIVWIISGRKPPEVPFFIRLIDKECESG